MRTVWRRAQRPPVRIGWPLVKGSAVGQYRVAEHGDRIYVIFRESGGGDLPWNLVVASRHDPDTEGMTAYRNATLFEAISRAERMMRESSASSPNPRVSKGSAGEYVVHGFMRDYVVKKSGRDPYAPWSVEVWHRVTGERVPGGGNFRTMKAAMRVATDMASAEIERYRDDLFDWSD